MQNNGQNIGGQQSHGGHAGGGQGKDGHHEQKHQQKPEFKAESHKNAQDKAKIWQKIEGAVAKDKIDEFKQEFAKSQEGKPDAGIHKKRRRRRRKKNKGENPVQGVPQKVEAHQYNQFQQPRPSAPVVSPFDYDQTFGDDEVKEEKADEPIFEDVDNASQPTDVIEPAQVEPEVPPSPAVVADEVVEEEVPEAQQVVQPLEPEPVPPMPPVAPVNPFDFGPAEETPHVGPALPPNTTIVEPINPFDNQHAYVQEEENSKPINPFDLTDSVSSVEDKKEADRDHRVTPVDQGVYEEATSPEDTGESDEFKSVNSSNSDETSSVEESDVIEDMDKKPEVIEVKASDIHERKINPVFPENIDKPIENVNEGKDDFWLILEHAGITKQKLVMFGIILVVILVGGLFFIFGGMNLFSSSSSAPQSTTQQPVKRTIVNQDKSQPKPVSATGDQQSSSTKNDRPYDVISSYIFGVEYQRQNSQIQVQPISAIGTISGVDAGLIFGNIANLKQERFVEYVKLLEQMNNIYNIDVYSLLNLSVDRRATLDKYLKDMNNLIDQGDAALASIQGDLVEFNTQYDATSKQASIYQSTFFTQVKTFYGQSAYDSLQLFMDTSTQAVKTKAQYGAENILKTMFVNSLAAMRPRYKDISTNTEALIKGVKVFDIKGSDINAIIPVQ